MSRVGSVQSVSVGYQPEERRKPVSGLGAKFAAQREAEKVAHANATRIHITAEQKAKFAEAFEAIDENKNGLLESDEIYNALRYCGIRLSADELDYMLTSVKHDDAIGMTLEEFTDMMHQAELGFTLGGGKSGMPSLGGMLQKNMKKVLKYKSKEAEALAIRNEIAHKQQDGGDMLDDFLSKENAHVCARCHSKYDPDDNREGSCTYHKQQGKTSGNNVENHQQTIIFPCCNRVQIGLSPVCQEAKGCCIGRHVTPEQVKANPSLRPSSAIIGVMR